MILIQNIMFSEYDNISFFIRVQEQATTEHLLSHQLLFLCPSITVGGHKSTQQHVFIGVRLLAFPISLSYSIYNMLFPLINHKSGQQFYEQRHKVQRSFQLNATTSVEVDMMFLDDSAEVMMLYDTNCSATVVRLAFTGRLASLLLLPKGEIQPLEDCLSDSRMSFWLSNLKPGQVGNTEGWTRNRNPQ